MAQAVVDTFLADAFALGVVVFAMALEDYPWQSTSRGSCRLFDYAASFGLRRFLRKRRLRNRRSGEVIADTLSPDLAEVIEALLQLKPRKRASLGDACGKRRKMGSQKRRLGGVLLRALSIRGPSYTKAIPDKSNVFLTRGSHLFCDRTDPAFQCFGSFARSSSVCCSIAGL